MGMMTEYYHYIFTTLVSTLAPLIFYAVKMQLYTMLCCYGGFLLLFLCTALSTWQCMCTVWTVSFSSHRTQSHVLAFLRGKKIHPSVRVSDSRFSSLRTKLNVTQPGGSRRKTRHYFSFCVKLFEPELQPECSLMEIDGVQKPTHCHAVDYKYILHF